MPRFENLGQAIEAVRNRDLTGLYTQIVIDLTTARTNQVLEMSGSKIFAITASDDSAALTIRFNEIRNDAIPFQRGREVSVPFYRFYLTNAAQAGVTITIEVVNELDVMAFQDHFAATDISDRAARDVGYTRTFWFNELTQGRTFGRGIALGASVGNSNLIQLFNPAGSGRIIRVYDADFTSTVTGTRHRWSFYNVALANLVGVGENLNSGHATLALGEIRWVQQAANVGTRFIDEIKSIADTQVFLGPRYWIAELGAGEGMVIQTLDVNIGTGVNFRWNEVIG